MAQTILKLGGSSYHPSAANTGNEASTVLRGKNMFLRGSDGSYYFEAFKGIKDLNEPIPMVQASGTISYTNGSTIIVGVGTDFKDELRFGQKFIAGDPTQVFVVEDILSATSMTVQRPPDASGSTQEFYKLPHLFEIDNKRGTLIWGNAYKFDRGNIVAVGEGRLRLNGDPLPGESLIATRRLQIALFNPATNDYEIGTMGFDDNPEASGVSITVVAGGTRDMTQGQYSFRWSWANSRTGYGFSNPSEVIKLDASSNPIAVTATNQRFQLDFTVGLASKPANADSIIVYRSLYSDAAQNLVQKAEGSWFVAATSKIADLEAGDILFVDVLDGELSTEVTFDNNPPPNADWVSVLAGDPILISCYGDTVVGGGDLGEAPGPFVSPSRRGNRDGYPAALATVLSPPETIIGFLPAVGRLFLMTRTGLPFAASTGQSDFPVETRAFWTTRFKSPYGLVFFNDSLWAFQITGPTRSIATGDEGSAQINFAAAVEDITREWYAGYVHAVYDPQNECIVFIYSASHRNEDGWWVSLALPFSLRHNAWMPLIEITKPNRDMIVSGAATIGSHLQFLAGGRGLVEEFDSGEGSGSEGEEIAILEEGLFVCGGECGVDEGNAHFATEAGGGLSFDTAVKRSGEYSIKIDTASSPSGTTCRVEFRGLGDRNIWVGKTYFRFESLPIQSNYVVYSGLTGGVTPDILGVAFRHTTGTLHCAGNLSGFGTPYGITFAGVGFTPTLNTWYRIDFKIDRVNGRVDAVITEDGQPTGATLTQANFGSSTGAGALRIGSWPNGGGGVWRYDDIAVSGSAADYPLNEGYVHGFLAVADGSHNVNAANRFERSATGTDITNATTDAHELIENVPLPVGNGTITAPSYIRGIQPEAAADYVEVAIGPAPGIPTPVSPPRIVSTVAGGYHGDNGNCEARVMLVDNNTLAEIWEYNGLGSPFIRLNTEYIPSPPSLPGEPWVVGGAGDGDFNNLKARFYVDDLTGSQDMRFSGLIVEAEFAGEEP